LLLVRSTWLRRTLGRCQPVWRRKKNISVCVFWWKVYS
jgi:hypothetical protein